MGLVTVDFHISHLVKVVLGLFVWFFLKNQTTEEMKSIFLSFTFSSSHSALNKPLT